MSHRTYHVMFLLMLAITTGLSACESSRIKEGEESTAKKSDELPPKDAEPQTWVATVENGDKPGNGYELVVHEGKITEGKFHLLDPNHPQDLAFAGQSVPFEDLTISNAKATFSITLRSGDGTYKDTLTISLLESLSGAIGAKAHARVQSGSPNTVSQELVFVRRE